MDDKANQLEYTERLVKLEGRIGTLDEAISSLKERYRALPSPNNERKMAIYGNDIEMNGWEDRPWYLWPGFSTRDSVYVSEMVWFPESDTSSPPPLSNLNFPIRGYVVWPDDYQFVRGIDHYKDPQRVEEESEAKEYVRDRVKWAEEIYPKIINFVEDFRNELRKKLEAEKTKLAEGEKGDKHKILNYLSEKILDGGTLSEKEIQLFIQLEDGQRVVNSREMEINGKDHEVHVYAPQDDEHIDETNTTIIVVDREIRSWELE